MQKNIHTGATLPDNPTLLPDTQTTNPDPEQVYAAGYRKINPFTCPEGMVIIPGTEQMLFDDAEDAFFIIHDVETPEEAQARAAAVKTTAELAYRNRILGLVDAYSPRVMILYKVLTSFGLEFPITYEAAAENIEGRLAAGLLTPEQTTQIPLLNMAFDRCISVMTGDELADVGAVIKEHLA